MPILCTSLLSTSIASVLTAAVKSGSDMSLICVLGFALNMYVISQVVVQTVEEEHGGLGTADVHPGLVHGPVPQEEFPVFLI